MKILQETCNKKAHSRITGIYRTKETQKMILIPGHLIQKEQIIVMVTQELCMEE